jgi:hypothetical protein
VRTRANQKENGMKGRCGDVGDFKYTCKFADGNEKGGREEFTLIMYKKKPIL